MICFVKINGCSFISFAQFGVSVCIIKGSPAGSQKQLKINDEGYKSLSYLVGASCRLHPTSLPNEQLISEQRPNFHKTITDSRLSDMELF